MVAGQEGIKRKGGMEIDAQVSTLDDPGRCGRYGQPSQDIQRWVTGGQLLGCKCLWVLRGEVWAVALGLKNGSWVVCLQSQKFARKMYGANQVR